MSDLPALDQPQAYVVVGPDDQRGPYTLELLIGEVVSGRLHDATPVWWPGLADWTTMTAHPGLAAEIARRRAPAPGAFAPPASMPGPQDAAPGQYQQADTYGYTQSGGAFPATATPGQDYSTTGYAGQGAAVTPSVEPSPPEEPAAEVSGVDQTMGTIGGAPVEAQDATQMAGETVAAEVGGGEEADVGQAAPIEVPPVDITPADFAAAGQEQPGFAAAGPAQGLDPRDGGTFGDVVARSRARADALSIVEDLDGGFVDALTAAAGDQGLTETSRQDDGDTHVLSFSGEGGSTTEVRLGKVTGRAMAVDDGYVDLKVTSRSTSYGGGAESGTGAHGEIVVSAAEWSGAASAEVALMLPLAQYIGDEYSLDESALRGDLSSVLSAVRTRLA